jgi:hypothetical protein
LEFAFFRVVHRWSVPCVRPNFLPIARAFRTRYEVALQLRYGRHDRKENEISPTTPSQEALRFRNGQLHAGRG